MDKFLRTALLILGIVVLVLLLFNLGVQLYWMIAGPTMAGFGSLGGGMLAGRGSLHMFGGFGFLGPILGIALVGLIVAGIVALMRGQGEAPAVRASDSGETSTAPPK